MIKSAHLRRSLITALAFGLGVAQSLGPVIRCVCVSSGLHAGDCACCTPERECCAQEQQDGCKQAIIRTGGGQSAACAVAALAVEPLPTIYGACWVGAEWEEGRPALHGPPRIKLPDLSTETLRAPPRFV